MKRLATAAILATTVIALSQTPASTAPKPAKLPVSWQLDIELNEPQAIELTLPGQPHPQRFWYLRYTITNRTGKDRTFAPEFLLYTDTGQVLREGQKVPIAVFKAIKKIYNAPLMKDMTAMRGRLLQDDDNAKDGVAIWRDFDPKAGAFDIFLGGLSGETVEIQLPVPVEVAEMDPLRGEVVKVTKDKIILSKTLHLGYSIAGEAAARTRIKPKLDKKEWIMR